MTQRNSLALQGEEAEVTENERLNKSEAQQSSKKGKYF